jgi:hypothetical protein
MKLRIEGNTLRLRLRKSEVAQLAKNGRVADHTQFPNGKLEYVLELKTNIKDITAIFSAQEISIGMPEAWGKAWVDDSRVGFQAALRISDDVALDVLVEKDFVCLDRDLNLQADQFPHPKTSKP